MNDFKTRRDSILQVFSQAKDDLEKLNSDKLKSKKKNERNNLKNQI